MKTALELLITRLIVLKRLAIPSEKRAYEIAIDIAKSFKEYEKELFSLYAKYEPYGDIFDPKRFNQKQNP
jgi:hypothetical protein